MNYTYLKNLIDKALCDIADLKNSVIKKIKIYFNDIEIESDTTSINFEGTGVENVETDDSGNVIITITGSDPIQSDWSETNVVDPSFIQNKPTPTDLIFTGNVTTTQTGPNEITVDVLGTTAPYKSYVARITLNAGVIVNEVINNTFNETFTWSYSATNGGQFSVQKSTNFNKDKIYIPVVSRISVNGANSAGNAAFLYGRGQNIPNILDFYGVGDGTMTGSATTMVIGIFEYL